MAVPNVDTAPRVLTSTEEMAALIGRLAEEGAASIPVIDDATCRALLAEARRLPYRVARETIGEGESAVRQDFELCMSFPAESPFWPFAAALEGHLAAALAALDPPPVAGLKLNDLIVQRYQPGSAGITPHRDHVRYIGLVALVTLAGAGRLYVCADRGGTDAREIPAPPGALVLMRAPGFAGLRDRPFHFLKDITAERYSLGLRHDTQTG